MGLMLSLLVTCVGVLEALACWRHFRAGYMPLPLAHADGKCVTGSLSSSSSDSGGSVNSLGAYYCRDESLSKYGLTPILSEHRRKQPNGNYEDDNGAGDECGCEKHCGGVGGCEELVTDTLPTIEKLPHEPEEELALINRKLGDSEQELHLQENHFTLENTERISHKDSNSQRRDFLDENENVCEDVSPVDHTVSLEERVHEPIPKPKPPKLHFKAPTGDDNDEPEEFTTIISPPKGTVDRAFTVEEIRGNVNKENAEINISKFPTDQRKLEDSDTKTEAGTANDQPCKETYSVGPAESVNPEHTEGGETHSRSSLTWAVADELFRRRSSSQSPRHSPQRSSPARKLPNNVDISWPSFTPQHLFRHPATSPAQLWLPSWDRRRASCGDVSADSSKYSQDCFNRSSSLGPRTRRSTDPLEYFIECPDPQPVIVTKEPERRKDSGEGFCEDSQSSDLNRSRADAIEGEGYGKGWAEKHQHLKEHIEEKKCMEQKQGIPYSHEQLLNNNSFSKQESEVTSGTKQAAIGVEYSEKSSATYLNQEGYSERYESNKILKEFSGSQAISEDAYVDAHKINQEKLQSEITDSNRKVAKKEQCETESAEEMFEGPVSEGSVRERFAMEKNEPWKKQRRPVKVLSFEREDAEKSQRKSRRSIATEQSSDDEGDDRSADHSTSSLGPAPGEPFWLIFSGEYTKAMSKDWHSGHFSCWQCDESLTGQRYVLRDDHPYCIKCYESVFANVCEECNKIIGIDSKDLSYKEKHWHEACFLCNKCRVSLVDKQFGSKGEKIYCGNCYDAQFASRCDGCGEIFRAGTKKMEYKTRQWHEKCFCCCVCKTPIGTKSFIPREQEIYCANCYEEKFATRCVKCNKIITSGGVTYKNEPWHRECFTCTNCNTSLAGQRFTSRDEKPYCAECFGELFAKRCTSCSKPITGIGGTRFISFEDRHWHNDCFICAMCKTSLVGRGFITDADDIICPDCAKQKLM